MLPDTELAPRQNPPASIKRLNSVAMDVFYFGVGVLLLLALVVGAVADLVNGG